MPARNMIITHWWRVALLLPALLLTAGCSRSINKTLSPPADSRWVQIEIKNPSPWTIPLTLGARYISHKCLKQRRGAAGERIEEPSYNVIQLPLQQQGQFWRGRVALTGGGRCQWTLSLVAASIEYIDATHLGNDLVPGTPVGVKIAFDQDALQGGWFDTVFSDHLMLAPTYYPYIKSDKMRYGQDTLNLFGATRYLKKHLIATGNVITLRFHPTLDESKVVRMVAPKENKLGDFFRMIYPDGTVVSDGSTYPDVRRLK